MHSKSISKPSTSTKLTIRFIKAGDDSHGRHEDTRTLAPNLFVDSHAMTHPRSRIQGHHVLFFFRRLDGDFQTCKHYLRSDADNSKIKEIWKWLLKTPWWYQALETPVGSNIRRFPYTTFAQDSRQYSKGRLQVCFVCQQLFKLNRQTLVVG